ncbi:MAG: lysostaphin resistance A-like protein, partial [Phycisphaeraceae bacterium]
MTLHELISIAQYVVVGLSLAILIYMIWRGELSEKKLRLGPTRDLHQPRVIYLLGICLVMGYAVIKLQLDSDSSQNLRILFELVPVVIIALMFSLAMRTDVGFRSLGLLPRHPLRDLRWGLLGGVMCFGIAGAASMLAVWAAMLLKEPVPQVSHETLVVLRESFSLDLLIAIVLSAVVIAPLFEELIFRGVLQTSLMRLMNGYRWPALVITAAVFSAIHGSVVPTQALAPLFVLGLAWGYLYERTGSLLAPILAHAVFNAMNIAIALTL